MSEAVDKNPVSSAPKDSSKKSSGASTEDTVSKDPLPNISKAASSEKGASNIVNVPPGKTVTNESLRADQNGKRATTGSDSNENDAGGRKRRRTKSTKYAEFVLPTTTEDDESRTGVKIKDEEYVQQLDDNKDDDAISNIDPDQEVGSDGYGNGHSGTRKGGRKSVKNRTNKNAVKKKRGRKCTISFRDRVLELKAFKEQHGHCRVSQRDPDYKNLGQFVKKIREYKKRMDVGKYSGSVLNEERVQELSDLGFEWISHKAKKVKSFEERIQDLKDYKAEFGHCNVPRVYEKDQSLGSWCHVLKISYRQIKDGEKPMKKLSPEKIQALEDVGFEWTRRRPPREKVEQKSFDQRLVELQVFKIKYGHLRVTEKLDKNLAHFCNHIRTARRYRDQKFNVMLITPERIKALDDLGFEWVPSMPRSGASFDIRLGQLKAFKEKYGHLQVTPVLDKSLATFCGKVRTAIRKPNKGDGAFIMTDDKVKALNDIGFEWQGTSTKISFEERLEELKAFKEEHKHLRVTSSHDKSLASFCMQARSAKAAFTMTEEKVKALDEIGFEWQGARTKASRKFSFEQRLEQLKAFKEKHKHLRVTNALDKSLASFCSQARSAKAKPSNGGLLMTEERIKALDELGFVWKLREKSPFEARVEQLKEFKEKHGHLIVTTAHDKSLAAYCSNIRYKRAKEKGQSSASGVPLSEEKIRILDEIGFEWNPNPNRQRVTFEDRLDQLKAFKEEHGHLVVTKSLDSGLATFCSRLRIAKKSPAKSSVELTEEKIKALDEIGFPWNGRNKSFSFEERLEQLKSYKEQHGNLLVSASHDKSLAVFCYNLRYAKKNPGTIKLTEEKIKSLEELGFDWNPASRLIDKRDEGDIEKVGTVAASS